MCERIELIGDCSPFCSPIGEVHNDCLLLSLGRIDPRVNEWWWKRVNIVLEKIELTWDYFQFCLLIGKAHGIVLMKKLMGMMLTHC